MLSTNPPIISDYERAGHNTVIVDAPTLIESGFNAECTAVIAVLADRETRIRRISLRDGISPDEAQRRVSAQKDEGFYISAADFVFRNEGDETFFERNALSLFRKLEGLPGE